MGLSYFKCRNRQSIKLDEMILGGALPRDILKFLISCDDAESVMAESAHRYRMFHVDFVNELDTLGIAQLARLSLCLPRGVAEAIVREMIGLGHRISAVRLISFGREIGRLFVSKRHLITSCYGRRVNDARIADFYRENNRMPMGDELFRVLSPHDNLFWDEVWKSSICGMVGQLDWIRACSCVDEDFIAEFSSFLCRQNRDLVKEFGRQLIYGADDPVLNDREASDDLKLAILEVMGSKPLGGETAAGQEVDLTFLFDDVSSRRFLCESNAPGYEIVATSLSGSSLPGANVPDIVQRAARHDNFSELQLARAIIGNDDWMIKLPHCLAAAKCKKLTADLILNDEFRPMLADALLFSVASLCDVGCARCILREVGKAGVVCPNEVRDCFGNNPLWYVRYRQSNEDAQQMIQLLEEFGFDCNVRNDMGLPMYRGVGGRSGRYS